MKYKKLYNFLTTNKIVNDDNALPIKDNSDKEYNNKTQAMQQHMRRKPVAPPIISGAVSFGNALSPQQNQNCKFLSRK